MSAVIFYLMEPGRSPLPQHHPSTIPPTGNVTLTDPDIDEAIVESGDIVTRWLKREAVDGGSPDSVGLIFR